MNFVSLVSPLVLACAFALAQDGHDFEALYAPAVHGSSETFRLNAKFAPLPLYPRSLRAAGKHGLVVMELAVSPGGNVVDSRLLEGFDLRASESVRSSLKQWRFYSVQELERFRQGLPRNDCYRINRLAFDFRIDQSGARVIDLAADEIQRTHFSNPFTSTVGRTFR